MRTSDTDTPLSREVTPLSKYIKSSGKLDLTGIDFDKVSDTRLAPQTIESLIYMADVEGSTTTYLRDMMATAAINDPDIARFLTLWAYEEMFHQEALVKFLSAYGINLDDHRVARLRSQQTLQDRLMMKAAAWLSHATTDFVPIYLTWGAINELSTLHAYQRLAAISNHPVLTPLLKRIVKDERRHFSFYFQRARSRLQVSPGARVLVSTAVQLFWRPVGHGLKTEAEIHNVLGHCLRGQEGLTVAREMDESIASLPGLAWFNRWERLWRDLHPQA